MNAGQSAQLGFLADGETLRFDGATIHEDPDAPARLGGQLARVFEFMGDGNWWTLQWLATSVGASEAGVSARLRDLRKPRFGGHTVERRLVAPGLFEYRLIVRR